METYFIEYDRKAIKQAMICGFEYLEHRDEIVGSVYAHSKLMKEIVLSSPDDVIFDYIPEGIGMFRTAYLKMLPSIRENEIRFMNQDMTVTLRMILK